MSRRGSRDMADGAGCAPFAAVMLLNLTSIGFSLPCFGVCGQHTQRASDSRCQTLWWDSPGTRGGSALLPRLRLLEVLLLLEMPSCSSSLW